MGMPQTRFCIPYIKTPLSIIVIKDNWERWFPFQPFPCYVYNTHGMLQRGQKCQKLFWQQQVSPNNPPRIPPNISSAVSTDHHSLLEYTSSLEGTLENATEHAATITLDNTTILQKLDAQQKTILEQQAKFMALLAQTDLTPFAPPAALRNQRNRPNATTPTEGRCIPCFCNSCRKEKCYHEDDECFALEKNKNKCPSWYKKK